jgi:hypothetical protein
MEAVSSGPLIIAEFPASYPLRKGADGRTTKGSWLTHLGAVNPSR